MRERESVGLLTDCSKTNTKISSEKRQLERVGLLTDCIKTKKVTGKELICVYENTLVQQMKYPAVKQQNAFPICGALALAYSVTLFLGQNPEVL
jgi:hypothetical protein